MHLTEYIDELLVGGLGLLDGSRRKPGEERLVELPHEGLHRFKIRRELVYNGLLEARELPKLRASNGTAARLVVEPVTHWQAPGNLRIGPDLVSGAGKVGADVDEDVEERFKVVLR